jgi:flagellar motor switch protein FliN
MRPRRCSDAMRDGSESMREHEQTDSYGPATGGDQGPAIGLAEPPAASASSRGPAPVHPARQVLRLPVTLSVHVASRRMELKQLLALAPGSLITFNKACDELLDLYVNNQQYARGEAVKVGEKFGLKIDEIGPPSETW